jgi:hypothetical protein
LALGEEAIRITNFDSLANYAHGRIVTERMDHQFGFFDINQSMQWIKRMTSYDKRSFELTIYSMAEMLADSLGKDTLICIFTGGQGTTMISQLGKGSLPYVKFLNDIESAYHAAKERGWDLKMPALCWMQGESDAYNDTYTEKYKENTIKLVSYLREDLGAYVSKEINFIDAFISKRSYWTNYKEVNKAREDAHYIIQNSSLIKTNGEDKNAIDLFVDKEPEKVDKAHYDSLSMVMLGREFGKRIIELIS